MRRTYLTIVIFVAVVSLLSLFPGKSAAQSADADYKQSKEYLALRDSVYNSFNNADSTRFFVAIERLENYLLEQNDLHAYYTQRCNEIIFQLNRQRVFEAYKLATQLSKELTDRKLDKEMYMAINMMGHIYRYSGNKESAKRCFWEVIRRMEQEGYIESQPPIYMNLVNIIIDENPEEALRLIDQAAAIAKETSPERLFDIETRRTLAYYLMGDTQRFLDGYKAYRKGVADGLSSVHGRTLEVYYLAQQGKIDEAAQMAMENNDDPYETQAEIYSKAGRWKEAYEALKLGAAESDSINSVILSSSMQGIQEELRVYDMERQTARIWFYAIIATVILLFLLVLALVYIVYTRRRHLREMQQAYQQVLESEQMKSDFIQNVSHEVRTPLNIISGFAQVLADPEYGLNNNERHNIAETMMHNTDLITTMINEVLEISRGDEQDKGVEMTYQLCNPMLQRAIDDFCKKTGNNVEQFHLETELPEDFVIHSNDDVFRRILNPLLDNAVKNASKEKVILRASILNTHIEGKRGSKKNSPHLVIAVEDNGPGIPVEEAEHIFERFVKLDSFKESLGLGLPFCRTMARRMGGDVRLDTTFAGPGARFEVVFPIKNGK